MRASKEEYTAPKAKIVAVEVKARICQTSEAASTNSLDQEDYEW